MPLTPIIQKPSSEDDFHTRSAAELLTRFQSTAAGLSSHEAALRFSKDGPNELKEVSRTGALQIFLDQFKSLIVWILIAAGFVSGIAGEITDALAILAIVIINAVIGFYQEYRAEKSINALQKLTAPHAKVRRDGGLAMIPAREIVVGDILAIEAGDLIPADARLIESAALQCIEAALTGESQSVAKRSAILNHAKVALGDRHNMVFMGTSVAVGTGLAVTVSTGMQTELGHIAGLMVSEVAGDKTPLQKRLNDFGRVLVWVTLGIVVLLFGLGLFRGTEPLELLLTTISLAVAAVPEGLPAVVTVALALGVRRMARRNALIRKLAAVETLGSTTVICTDKTGTLTVGEMTVRALYVGDQSYGVTGEGYGPEGEIQFKGVKVDASHSASLVELGSVLLACNTAHRSLESGKWKLIGDPTEGALLAAGGKTGADSVQIEKNWPKVGEIPFDSNRKRSSTLRRMIGGSLRAFSNGAPGPLLKVCSRLYTPKGIRPITDEDRAHILSHTSAMARKSLRVLASAYRDLEEAHADGFDAVSVEKDMVFVGLSGMHDPPRPQARVAVSQCREAGIRVVMITGDHPETATAIARDVGIASVADHAVTGNDLDAMSESELRTRIPGIVVYARVTAAHKLTIVRTLKAGGEVVAMTGDGVNDAPAIKGSDIGIAMGLSGTEVTKQAADMIITDDRFDTIVAAIEEGRGIYDNIRQTLQYLLAGSTGELLLMTLCLVAGMPMPLLPIHLLWINLVTDGLPALCLATDPIDPDVMKRGPRSRSESITNRRFLRTMFITGLLTAGVAFAVYAYVLQSGSVATARTSAFAVLVFAELFRAFGARSDTKPLWNMKPLFNRNLVGVVCFSVLLQVASQHWDFLGRILKTSYLPWVDTLWFFALGSVPLWILELMKVIRNRRETWKSPPVIPSPIPPVSAVKAAG